MVKIDKTNNKFLVDCYACKGKGQMAKLDDIQIPQGGGKACTHCHGKGVVEYFKLKRRDKDYFVKYLTKSEIEEFRAKLTLFYLKNEEEL